MLFAALAASASTPLQPKQLGPLSTLLPVSMYLNSL